MTATRSLNNTTFAGATWPANVADTVNTLSGYIAGNAVSVAGTNAITCTLDVTTGFTGPTDGMMLALRPAADNTGAVTLNIASTGAKAVVDPAGDALAGGELITDKLYILRFLGGADDEWRIVTLNEDPAAVDTGPLLAAPALVKETTSQTSTAWTYTAPATTTLIRAEGFFIYSISTTTNAETGGPEVRVRLLRGATVMDSFDIQLEEVTAAGGFPFFMEAAAGVTSEEDWTVDVLLRDGDNLTWTWHDIFRVSFDAKAPAS